MKHITARSFKITNNLGFYPLIVVLVFLIFFPLGAQVNKNVMDILVNNFQENAEKVEQESVYIQTNKEIYETGEDLWFKAYVLDSQFFIPSHISKVLFVQLINDKTNEPVWEEKYGIENGFVDGHLFINDTLPEGNYRLATYSPHSFYTNSSEFYAFRNLKIVNRINHKFVDSLVKEDSTIHFMMFPEGGDLVTGLPNTLAFKASDSNGRPLNVSGTLYENNIPIKNIKTIAMGMGRLEFVPDISKEYYINLEQQDSAKKHGLPKILGSGVALKLLRNTEDTLTFKVFKTNGVKSQKIYLRTQVRGIVYSIATANLTNMVEINLPLNDLPQGIAEVTLFDEELSPLAERLVYINQDRKINIQTKLDKSEYDKKDKVSLKIKATDENGLPVVSHLGLSVFDRAYHNGDEVDNILSYYLLSTQIKGQIYNPQYYFDKSNKDRKVATDLLLLTQGWRRYLWSDSILSNLTPPKQVVFDEIQGNIGLKSKNGYIGNPVILPYVPGENNTTNFISIDSMGRFSVGPDYLKVESNSHVYLRLMVPKDQNYTFNLNDNAFQSINLLRKNKATYSSISILDAKSSESMESRLPLDINKLDEVVLEVKKRKLKREKYLSKLDSLAKMELTTDYVCKHNILNCPIHVVDRDNKKPVEGEVYFVLKVWDNNLKQYVEGVAPQIGQGFINPPLPPYRYPVLTDEDLLRMYNIIKVKGFYGQREFYEPIYSGDIFEETLADYRNTLIWKPDIITNENGEASISFYCSDLDTKFIGVIEGVSGDGLLGTEKFEFAVNTE